DHRRDARPRDGGAERADRERDEDRRRVAPPGAALADHAREHVEVGERDRVAGAPPLEQPVAERRDRQRRQRQEQQRVPEAHQLPPAQIALTWTTARTPEMASPPRAATSTLRPR